MQKVLAEQAQIVDASKPDPVDSTLIEQHRPSTSLLLTFAAPWIGLVRPSKAGELLANSSWLSFGIVLLLHITMTICLALLVIAWHDSVQVAFEPRSGNQIPTLLALNQNLASVHLEKPVYPVLKERPIFEVLRSKHDPNEFDPIDVVVLVVFVVSIGLTLFLAWLRLADHHEGGSAWRSYFRCWKCLFALTGFVWLVEALIWVPITLLDHLNARMTVGEIPVIPWLRSLAQSFWNTPFSVAVNMVAVLWVFFASGRAVRGGRKPISPTQFAPMCEGCGYDLSHQGRDTRCPECGRDVHTSLTPGLARNPHEWETKRLTAILFLKTSYEVLTSMVSRYSSMEVRNAETQAERFRGIHYFLISLGAALWGFVCIMVSLVSKRSQEEAFLEAAMGALLVFLLASIIPWILQRVLAAFAYTWWLIRKSLPDPRWSRKVLAYETVYFWLFCCFNGTLVTSFIIFGAWITESVGEEFSRALVGEPPETFLMFGGNAILCVLWLYRYYLAMKAIRWANF